MIKQKKIHLIYFSSGKHFKYLVFSLKSLLKLRSNFVGNIYLYIDEVDFLNKRQIDKLKKINLSFIIRKTNNITGLGMDYILSELKAFVQISKRVSGDDYIAKVDSDIIFLNDEIFKTVIESNKMLIGHKDSGFGESVYTQGGLYFIKLSFVPKMFNFDQENIFKKIINDLKYPDGKQAIRDGDYKKIPEDCAIYRIILNKTNQILFVQFMYTPKIFVKAGKDHSVMHFIEYRKEAMKYYFYAGYTGLFFYIPFNYLFHIYYLRFNLIGKIGVIFKKYIPNLYNTLKPYFPDRRLN